MKAILIKSPGGPEQLTIGEWEKPRPAANEILVKVAASAINRADTLQRMGKYPVPPGASPILGLEMAGTVVEIGKAVTQWKEGDTVCGLLAGGGHAEYATIHEDMAISVPQNMSMTDAAALPEVFLTAFQAMVWIGNLTPGEKVLIHAGGSGVGTAAIQLAKSIGATIMITASAGKHEMCRSLGAELTIDYHTEDFHQSVKEFTNGYGADLIIDFVAAPYFQQNLDTLALDGRLVMLALLGGTKASELNIGNILRKRLKIQGSTLRNRDLTYKTQLTKAFQAFAWEDIQAGRIKPVIDQVVDWTQIADAHRRMEANQNTGKIVLKISAQ
ncbi:UNVERIFIED_CONTAM: hypothetical protein GTU68_015813 [Idotea baltica]|nr:hypothetical protein [Idotea baltica]